MSLASRRGSIPTPVGPLGQSRQEDGDEHRDDADDYQQLDKPTIVRQRAVGDGLRTETDAEELLDIPAFLRRPVN